MSRPEDSPWAVSVAQIAARAGESKAIDRAFPAPEGIGDEVVGVTAGDDVQVTGSFDSIVDGIVFTGRISAPAHAECTRCLKPITHDWTTDVTAFFPFDANADANGRNADKGEVDIVAGEEESEDTYPLVAGGAFADIESLLRDALVEALPLQPLCRPGCRGLCSQCGEDLNEHPDHHHDVADIRFAALADLKARLEAQQDGRDGQDGRDERGE